jgi:hypothetical protein
MMGIEGRVWRCGLDYKDLGLHCEDADCIAGIETRLLGCGLDYGVAD